jgi:hypothetical protein
MARTGLCDSLLKHAFLTCGTSLDPSSLLGMVNVAHCRLEALSIPPGPALSIPPGPALPAFVVGINDYSALPKLGLAVKDAEDVAALLGRKGYEVTHLPNPSRSDLVTAFDAFCDSVRNHGSVHRVVVYFAGHGFAPSGDSFLAAKDSTSEVTSNFVCDFCGLLACRQRELPLAYSKSPFLLQRRWLSPGFV